MLCKKGNDTKIETKRRYGVVLDRINLVYPYYKYDNEMYCSFIKDMMNSLEIRKFIPNQIIYNEMEESAEILFVEKGKYDVGYKINNKVFLRR